MSGAMEASGGFEVPTPILNSPFAEPAGYWDLREGEPPEQMQGRRSAGYYYRDPRAGVQGAGGSRGVWRDMPLVNTIRARLKEWQDAERPGISRVTAELIAWWEREGRNPRLFYAQREAAETIIFLTEARADFLQGIAIPRDDPGEERRAQGYPGFERRACKMATGTGKSTVAAMLAAWSILNKQADRGDARFSDTVLIVCPNVTIRRRLGELDPRTGEASLYRTRDLVPPAMMADLARGRVLIKNWHEFEPGTPEGGGGARVVKAGKPEVREETIVIAERMTSARGNRYYTPTAYEAAKAAGTIRIKSEELGEDGTVRKATVYVTRMVESDAALVDRVLKEAGGKQNILVINDEAHHAYRIPPKADEQDDEEEEDEEGQEEEEVSRKEATVWIDGLDKIAKQRGINFCIDLTATPYYLGRMGNATNTAFPWVVSDFGLTDAIESGLVKVPQLVARDGSGADLPAYFNIWAWILPLLRGRERGTKPGSPQPEAILKWSHHPIAVLGGMWNEKRREWAEDEDPRPPVFILVCKNKRIAARMYEWIGENKPPTGIPPFAIPELHNTPDRRVTIRVDTGVVHETDTGNAKSDENTWMRLTLDTVGKTQWPTDQQGRPIYPDGFEELAKKLERPLHPPGRDIRCIVSVGMLTEGWDCNTVTHVVGLRPFQSQLLCEQVVGRALRRRFYNPDPENDDRFDEEVAQIFGVPFEVVPFKATGATPKPRPPQRRIHAVAQKAQYAITVPRVMGYSIGIRNRVMVDWPTIARTVLDPSHVPPETHLAAMLNHGKPSALSPGGLHRADLSAFHRDHREQQLCFQMAADLTRHYVQQGKSEAPSHVLFPQLLSIVQRYIAEKVDPLPPAQTLDALLAPYYGWVIERLLAAIRPDTEAGEAPELPELDRDRPCATADISHFTSKRVREAVRSHVNLVVVDSIWEAQAAELLDLHQAVGSYIKNDGLNFTVPYLHNGKPSDYLPDYVIRLNGGTDRFLIAEVKGADWGGLAEIKAQAAHRWCAAVNATSEFGHWDYHLAYNVRALATHLDGVLVAAS